MTKTRIDFIIRTTPQLFHARLLRYLQNVNRREFPTERGYYTLYPPRLFESCDTEVIYPITQGWEHEPCVPTLCVELSGSWTVLPKGSGNPGYTVGVGRQIWFNLLELGDSRLEVEAHNGSESHLLDAFFQELLDKIGEWWPIERQSPKDNPSHEQETKSRGAPRRQERADWPEKLEKVREYEAYRARGLSSAIAAQRTGHSVNSIKTWQKLASNKST